MSPIIEDTNMEYAEANKDVTLHVLNRIALALYPVTNDKKRQNNGSHEESITLT